MFSGAQRMLAMPDERQLLTSETKYQLLFFMYVVQSFSLIVLSSELMLRKKSPLMWTPSKKYTVLVKLTVSQKLTVVPEQRIELKISVLILSYVVYIDLYEWNPSSCSGKESSINEFFMSFPSMFGSVKTKPCRSETLRIDIVLLSCYLSFAHLYLSP